jgi:nucleoside-diphosphate-sugar epimerase
VLLTGASGLCGSHSLRSEPESVLLTGASGLCGSHVLEYLLARPDRFTVSTMARRAVDREGHFRHDLRNRLPEDLIPGRLDAVVHCAAAVNEQDASYDVVDANVRATFNLVAFARARGVKVFVNLSSIAVYGAPAEASSVPETAPLRPRTAYGVAKVLTEALISCHASEMAVVHLRLGYVLAPVMPHRYFLVRMGRRLAANDPVEIVNPDSTRFPFIEVADVARACGAALAQAAEGALNLVADDRPTLREVVEAIAHHHPASSSPRQYLERPDERFSQCFDTTRAKTLMGVERIGDPLAAIRAAAL